MFAPIVSQELGVSCLVQAEQVKTGRDPQPFNWACASVLGELLHVWRAYSLVTPAQNKDYHTFFQSPFPHASHA